VCSTPIADVVSPYGENGLVEIGADAAQFSAKLDLLLKHDRSEWLRRVDGHLQGMSWDRTWSEMSALLEATRHVAGLRARVASAPVQQDGDAVLDGAAYV
jgi:hypothetical protein